MGSTLTVLGVLAQWLFMYIGACFIAVAPYIVYVTFRFLIMFAIGVLGTGNKVLNKVDKVVSEKNNGN